MHGSKNFQYFLDSLGTWFKVSMHTILDNLECYRNRINFIYVFYIQNIHVNFVSKLNEGSINQV